jgi:hypothetical protein
MSVSRLTWARVPGASVSTSFMRTTRAHNTTNEHRPINQQLPTLIRKSRDCKQHAHDHAPYAQGTFRSRPGGSRLIRPCAEGDAAKAMHGGFLSGGQPA